MCVCVVFEVRIGAREISVENVKGVLEPIVRERAELATLGKVHITLAVRQEVGELFRTAPHKDHNSEKSDYGSNRRL